MKVKRLSCAMLFMVMLASTFAGCSSDTSSDATDTTVNTALTEGEITTEPEIKPEVKDFDGYEFRLLGDTNDYVEYYYSEGVTGDTINDIVYERNLSVEEAYGIKINYSASDAIADSVTKNVQAGDDFADIPMIRIGSVYPLVQEGYFHDWYDYSDAMMLDAEWWDQRVFDQLEIGDRMYTLFGDYSIQDEFSLLILYYNKQLYEDNGFDNVYDTVESGKWTFDYFWKTVTAVSADLNGDGVMNENDRFGLLTEYSAFNYFYTGSGYMPIISDKGELKLNIGNEKSFNIVEKMQVIGTEKNLNSLIADDGNLTGSYETTRNMLKSRQGLYLSGTMSGLKYLRDSEEDFGVLPIPKYEESQDSYYNLVSWNGRAAVMPITVEDPARTALILDAMGYYSMKTVNPVFFNIFLDEKVTRDEESKKMLDIIFDTKTYDIDWYANITGFAALLGNIAKSGQNNFASEYAKIETAVQTKLDDFIAGFAN